MQTLYQQLNKSLAILEQRKMMIPKYINQPNWLGHNHYSMDMIPKLEKQIDELKAAINGIKIWRKNKIKPTEASARDLEGQRKKRRS